MKTTRHVDDLGQNIWLANITQDLREIKALRRICLDVGILFPAQAIDHKNGTTVAIFETRRRLTWL
jgi:hypothetical protein